MEQPSDAVKDLARGIRLAAQKIERHCDTAGQVIVSGTSLHRKISDEVYGIDAVLTALHARGFKKS